MIIDSMKINFKGRYYQGETILSFISDQLIHIAIIAIVIPFRIPPPDILSTKGLSSLYYNDKFIFYSIAYVFVSSGGIIFSAALKNTFSKTIIKVDSISLVEKTYGALERILLTCLIMRGFNILPIVVAISPRLIPGLKKKIGGAGDTFINYCLSLCIGLVLRKIYG
jgi:hypothetical protein